LLVNNNGRKEILVAGIGGNYLLGLGPNRSVSEGTKFNKVDYPSDLVEIIDIDAKGLTIFALGSDGKVYAWGDADSK